MPIEALDLAHYVVQKCIDDGCPISNLQLQRILYCIQKEYLLHDKKAFVNDIEAWRFGPCVPKVYNYYSVFGTMGIPFAGVAKERVPGRDKQIIDPIIEENRMLDCMFESLFAWTSDGDKKVISAEMIIGGQEER